MKIVFPRIETMLFHEAYDGGTKYIYYLAKELVKQGVEVIIATTTIGEHKPYSEKTVEGVKYVFLPPLYTGRKRIVNIPWKMAFAKNLKKYLNSIDFDVLHSAESFALHYLKQKKRQPVIYQCWGLEAWYGTEALSQTGWRKFYVKHFLRNPWQKTIDKSDSVASDGEFQLQKVLDLGVPRDKIFYLPNGVNYQELQQKRKKYRSIRKKHKLSKKDFIILSVCQIAPDKGIEDIINGFARLKKEVKQAKLIMIGKGNLEEMMHNLIKEKGLQKEVIHLKNVPEYKLYDYYFSSDVFVSASTTHDFKICIQEAMACGLPIVSSGQPYLVENYVNGYVVGINNPKGISRAIQKMIRFDSLKKMGENSLKKAAQYDYSILAKTSIKEYKRLLKE